MQKAGKILVVCALSAMLLVGCGKKTQSSTGENLYQDGEYTAEVQSFDSFGYKDYAKVTVKNGVIVQVEFDATDKDSNIRSKDAEYRKKMESVENTYPEKYSSDLMNQYLQHQRAADVVAVAGASYSSESFKNLMSTLETKMISGDTQTITIENAKER